MKTSNITVLVLVFWINSLVTTTVQAKKTEAYYVDTYCTGEREVVMPNKSRADCIQDNLAIEYDWSYKWAECIGQALEYARLTGLRAGCVLIFKSHHDNRYVEKILGNIRHYGLPIDLFVIDQGMKIKVSTY